jgi:hypothetical protein
MTLESPRSGLTVGGYYLSTPLGTPLEVQLEDLDRFAKEVMPAFHPAKIAAAAE